MSNFGEQRARQDVFGREQARRSRAHQVLERLDLVRRWSRYGRVIPHGAMTYGLMVALDIDMATACPELRSGMGFDVVSEIAQMTGVRKVRYRNQLDDPGDPGLYYQIQYRDDRDDLWKVDAWLVPETSPSTAHLDRQVESLRRALTTESRSAILEIKEANQGQEPMRGIDIYQAVLDGGVRSVNDCRQWIADHPVEGMNWWLPE